MVSVSVHCLVAMLTLSKRCLGNLLVGCQLLLSSMPRLRFLEVFVGLLQFGILSNCIMCGCVLMCMFFVTAEKVSIQNVMNTTRILVNPDLKEAIDFKNGYVNYMIYFIHFGHVMWQELLNDLGVCQHDCCWLYWVIWTCSFAWSNG